MAKAEATMRGRGKAVAGGILAVAHTAGVSTTTVSRILTGGKSAIAYSEATRQRVMNAARSLQYVPNSHACRLARGRADHVALVVRPLASPFFGELADRFVGAFAEFNLRVSIDVADVTEEATVSTVRNFGGEMVDAIFVCPSHPSMSFERIKAAVRCPIIALVHKPADPLIPHVSFDLRAAARQGTLHLLRRGRRRIGYVGAKSEADGRFDGYCDALREAGIPSDPSWQVFDDLFLLERAQQAGEKLAGLSHPPDAVFVASDSEALGVIGGLGRKGLRVPEDVAIVSLNGEKWGAYHRPALTTMALPLPSMVNRCVEMVQAIHCGKTKREILAHSVSLQATRVARESCGLNIASSDTGESLQAWQEDGPVAHLEGDLGSARKTSIVSDLRKNAS